MKNAWPGSLGASSPSNQCFGEGCYFGIAEYVGFLEDANTVAQCSITTSQFNACSCCHSTKAADGSTISRVLLREICRGKDSVTSSHDINFFVSKPCFHRP